MIGVIGWAIVIGLFVCAWAFRWDLHLPILAQGRAGPCATVEQTLAQSIKSRPLVERDWEGGW